MIRDVAASFAGTALALALAFAALEWPKLRRWMRRYNLRSL